MTPKRAIGYVRISTKDQSNFSIEGQQDAIRKYCTRNGWELISITVDDGQSAKNFDRANWQLLEKYIKANSENIDYLVVMKYDRFSRNVSEALAKLDLFESRYNIRVMSVNEPIGMHPQSPYFFQFRTTMLMNGELELRIIQDRTKFGIVQAARSGRHVNHAPFGYKNNRDEQNKPIFEVVPEQALLVAEAYELYLCDVSISDIGKLLNKKGCKLKGKSAITRMLSNPVYAGLVRVPAYYDEPEELVESVNPAIVDKSTWWRVQAKLSGKVQNRTVVNEEVPLRGVVNCHCGRPLTAGNSKGRNRYYWYYKCMTHTQTNLKADVLHSQFSELLSELSLSEQQLSYLEKLVTAKLKESLQATKAATIARKKELDAVMANLDKLEEKYITGNIDPLTYKKWRTRWEAERYGIQQELEKLAVPAATVWERYHHHLSSLRDINYLYSKADIHQKQSFIKLVFNNQLWYQDGTYRTSFLLPIFGMKAASLQEKRLLIIEQPIERLREIPVRAPSGT